MNTNKYERREKEIRKLKKRQREIWEELRNKPLQELKKPYQKGWEIFYQLKDEVARRKDASEIWEKLNLVCTQTRTTRSIAEIKMIRRGQKGYSAVRNGQRVYIQLTPPRTHLRKCEYDLLDARRKSWFTMDIREGSYYKGIRYKCNLPEDWLVLKVRPHIVTHYYEAGGELESENVLVGRKLSLYGAWSYHHHKPVYPRGRKRVETRIAISRFMKGETEDIVFDKVMTPDW